MRKSGIAGRKAQVAMEYLFVVGFAFMMLLPLIALFYSQSGTIEEEVVGAQAEKIMSELISAIDTVYYLGYPSKQTLRLRFPEHIESITILGDTLVFTIDSPSGTYEMTALAAANLTGSLETFAGPHIITIATTQTGVSLTEN